MSASASACRFASLLVERYEGIGLTSSDPDVTLVATSWSAVQSAAWAMVFRTLPATTDECRYRNITRQNC
jgi:hypothetical protein